MISTDRLESNQFEPPGLKLKSHRDALNLANQLTQDSERWLSINELNAVNRYTMGNVEFYVNLRPDGMMNDCHLVFRSIPHRCENVQELITHRGSFVLRDRFGFITRQNEGTQAESVRVDGNRTNNRVFIGIGQFIQSPNKIIPSLVWLEGFDKSDNVPVDIPATSFNTVAEMTGIRGDGKESSFASNYKHGLIQGRAEIVNDFKGKSGQFIGESLNEFEFIHIKFPARVRLANESVWIALGEGIDQRFELLSAEFRSLN